ncbi:MAG: transcriptional regulator [Candidatus Thorarchaeota archaeon]
MLGVIISLAIVSGVLFYLDSTSGELVQAAFSDVYIDTVISDPVLTETETKTLQEFVLSDVSDLITSAEIIAVTKPFGPNTIRSIVAADFKYNLSSMENMRGRFFTEGNFTTTYIFGIEPSYISTFTSIFSTTSDIAQLFEKYLTNMENAGYIETNEEYWGERKITIYQITPKGHERFQWFVKINAELE